MNTERPPWQKSRANMLAGPFSSYPRTIAEYDTAILTFPFCSKENEYIVLGGDESSGEGSTVRTTSSTGD